MSHVVPRVAAPRCSGASSITMRNSWGEWLAAVAVCAFFLLFMMAYHDWWRAKPYSLGTANEGAALASTMGLATALLLGPLSRLTGRFRQALRLRRPLGIVALACALLHVAMMFGPLQANYPWAELRKEIASVMLGVLALAALAALVSTSFSGALQRLGTARWRRLQQHAYAVLALVLAHYLALGKVSAWLAWLRTHDHAAPQGTFVATCVGILPFLLKGIDLLASRQRPSAAGAAIAEG